MVPKLEPQVWVDDLGSESRQLELWAGENGGEKEEN